MAAKLTSLTQK